MKSVGCFSVFVWEAIEKKQELDLRSSRLASFDEMYELRMAGKLNWTAHLTSQNAEGAGAVVGQLSGPDATCSNMIQPVSNTNRFGIIWKLPESRYGFIRLHQVSCKFELPLS